MVIEKRLQKKRLTEQATATKLVKKEKNRWIQKGSSCLHIHCRGAKIIASVSKKNILGKMVIEKRLQKKRLMEWGNSY